MVLPIQPFLTTLKIMVILYKIPLYMAILYELAVTHALWTQRIRIYFPIRHQYNEVE
jgi:hypothetical protein